MGRPLNILCVDDDSAILTIIELSLSLDANIAVRAAADGNTALGLLARGEWIPDCILLDGRLPGRNGMLLFGEIRAMPRHADTPVIFLTASISRREVAEFIALGALGVIAKPFDPVTLATDIRRLIGA